MITVNNVSKSYHRDKIEIPVLSNITIRVPEANSSR